LDAFSEKSIDAVTVEEITDKADVAKGTLYQHFDDKEEIVVTLVEEAVKHLIEYMRSYDSAPDTLEEMLEHLLESMLISGSVSPLLVKVGPANFEIREI